MKTILSVLAVSVLVLCAVACSDDPKPTDGSTAVGDGQAPPPVNDGAGPPTGDAVLPWPDSKVYLDTQPLSCTVGDPNACNNAYTFFCDNGVCAPCPEYVYNCDHVGICECVGACDGTSCVGTLKCSYDEAGACDKDKWCETDLCVACPEGTFNCDGTQDCECTTGCKGTECK